MTASLFPSRCDSHPERKRQVQVPLYFVLVVAYFACTGLIGCHSGDANYKIHRELLRLAGENPRDCGAAKTLRENETASACALDAMAGKIPFIVQYRILGNDVVLQDGIAMNKEGKVNFVTAVESSKVDSWGKYNDPEVTPCSVSVKKREYDHSLYCW